MPPRRSTRKSAVSTIDNENGSASKAKTNHKRQLSAKSTPDQSTPVSRTSKRPRPSSATPGSKTTMTYASLKLGPSRAEEVKEVKERKKESQYFELPEATEASSEDTASEDRESAYEQSDSAGLLSPSAASGDDDDDLSESSLDGRKKGRSGREPSSRKGKDVAVVAVGKDKELWREGVKVGLGPGKQVFIEKPKPRGDGGIKYANDRIHPNTFAFLGDLKANNDREWFKMHEADYKASKNDWDTFVESLTEKIIEYDDTVPELPPKDLVFRIFRDVRFSSDKSPYKPHFSAAWSRTGRKGPYAHYYVQITPGNSLVGSGLWAPDAGPLALVRHEIDRSPEELKRILMLPSIRKDILGETKNDEKKAVDAFCVENSGSALKTKPKGFDADHPNIELLKLRSYKMTRKLKDEEVKGAKGLEHIAGLIRCMVPFVQFLNSVVMPDEADDLSQVSDEQ